MEKKLLATNAKTGFKIGGIVGIIILLLGVAVVFGILQMSKVSQEIIEISEEYSPLQGIVGNIGKQQLNQAVNFEKILRYQESSNVNLLNQAKEEFWLSGGIIESEISRANKIIQAGYNLENSQDAQVEMQSMQQRITDITILHNDYENLVRDVIDRRDNSIIQNNYQTNIIQKEIQLQNEIDELSNQIVFLIDHSTNQIEENESVSLLAQVIIISMVGGIAGALGLILNHINRDLENEVKAKTAELQAANEKLQKIDKMKDEFIGIASHELKSPIQPIFGFAELAKSGDIDQNEAWDGVTELAQKLQDLANDVLDVSRIESNRLILHKEKIRINDVINASTRMLKMNLRKTVKIEEKLDENIEIFADRVRLEQVIRNLLVNSIKFTSEGTIRVETHVNQEEQNVQVIVSDSGLGIPEEILPNIFEKFVTKGHGVENQLGTGLGLYLCKGIIEAHGGTISAKNNKKSGATFSFVIPLTPKKIEQTKEIATN